MVRLAPFAVALSLAGCSGEILSENLEGLTPEQQVALQKWVDNALPVFAAKCVMCHDGSMPDIGYLEGADDLMKRERLVTYSPRVVNLGAPQSSRVLTKGMHTGPALDAPEASGILSWIIAERDAAPEIAAIRTMQMVPMECTSGSPPDATCPLNTLDLTPLGTEGTFEFAVAKIDTNSYFTNIKIKAGAAGLHFEHPLFETWPAGATKPTPDPVDQFFAVTGNLAAGAEQVIGTASLAGFSIADPISIRFDVVEAKLP